MWVQIPAPPLRWLSDELLNFSQHQSLHLGIGKDTHLIGLFRRVIKYHGDSRAHTFNKSAVVISVI